MVWRVRMQDASRRDGRGLSVSGARENCHYLTSHTSEGPQGCAGTRYRDMAGTRTRFGPLPPGRQQLSPAPPISDLRHDSIACPVATHGLASQEHSGRATTAKRGPFAIQCPRASVALSSALERRRNRVQSDGACTVFFRLGRRRSWTNRAGTGTCPSPASKPPDTHSILLSATSRRHTGRPRAKACDLKETQDASR